MIIKPCFEPVELKIMRYVNLRMVLSSKEKQHYANLEKGYEGERKFEEEWLANITSDCLILNDLLLEYNNTIFQIDSLLILQKKILLFEVKNYEGDFYINEEKWHTISGNEVTNPLNQLKRSESLLRRLLQNQSLNLSIEAYLVFINPEFTVYQAPISSPIIFPTQLNRFMQNLNAGSSKLYEKHSKLADQLVAAHQNDSSFSRLPGYDYGELDKGITCAKCSSLLTSIFEKKLVCKSCSNQEDIDSAVLRSIKEFQLLFSERKITTNAIHEWCKVIESRKTIRRILRRNFNHIKHARFSYFEVPLEE